MAEQVPKRTQGALCGAGTSATATPSAQGAVSLVSKDAAQPTHRDAQRPPSCLLPGSTWALPSLGMPEPRTTGLTAGGCRGEKSVTRALQATLPGPRGRPGRQEDHSRTRPRADTHRHPHAHTHDTPRHACTHTCRQKHKTHAHITHMHAHTTHRDTHDTHTRAHVHTCTHTHRHALLSPDPPPRSAAP